MRRAFQLCVMGLVSALAAGGCRTATRVTQVPRVDLALEGGNRGYLFGSPAKAPELKATREIMETTVEVPSWYRPKPGGAQAVAEPKAPQPQAGVSVSVGQEAQSQLKGTSDAYVVQRGDSLWSIAAKPEIYGKASRWRDIYDANRDLLKSPDRLKAGMTLKIPRRQTGGGSTTYDDEGVTFKK